MYKTPDISFYKMKKELRVYIKIMLKTSTQTLISFIITILAEYSDNIGISKYYYFIKILHQV
jgi:hypothetical protein